MFNNSTAIAYAMALDSNSRVAGAVPMSFAINEWQEKIGVTGAAGGFVSILSTVVLTLIDLAKLVDTDTRSIITVSTTRFPSGDFESIILRGFSLSSDNALDSFRVTGIGSVRLFLCTSRVRSLANVRCFASLSRVCTNNLRVRGTSFSTLSGLRGLCIRNGGLASLSISGGATLASLIYSSGRGLSDLTLSPSMAGLLYSNYTLSSLSIDGYAGLTRLGYTGDSLSSLSLSTGTRLSSLGYSRGGVTTLSLSTGPLLRGGMASCGVNGRAVSTTITFSNGALLIPISLSTSGIMTSDLPGRGSRRNCANCGNRASTFRFASCSLVTTNVSCSCSISYANTRGLAIRVGLSGSFCGMDFGRSRNNGILSCSCIGSNNDISTIRFPRTPSNLIYPR